MNTYPLVRRCGAGFAVGALSALCSMLPAHAAALTDGLHGYWPLDEGEGIEVFDVSGNQPPGLILQRPGAMEPPEEGVIPRGLGADGSVWVTDPARGTVVGFTGTDTDGYILLGNELQPVTDNTDGFTWSFWARSDQGVNNDIIFGNRYSTNNDDFWSLGPRQWSKFTGNAFEYRPKDVDLRIDYANIEQSTQWTHHLAVRDTNSLRYYRNGVLLNTRAGLTATLDEAMPIYIGGQGRENWRGWVDDVLLFTRALSSQEAAFIYQLTQRGDLSTPGPAKLGATFPVSASSGASFDTTVGAALVESTGKVVDSSIEFRINGQVVPHTLSDRGMFSSNVAVVFVTAAAPVYPNLYPPLSTVNASVKFTDSTGATKEESWQFTVQDYVQVPGSWAVTNVDQSKRGFLVRTHMLSNRRHVFGDRGARTPPAENQLAGRIGPNVVNPAPFTTGGYFVEDTYINYNQLAFSRGDTGSSEGMFGALEIVVKPENPIPGLEGATPDPAGENTTGNDHAAVEILAYVELPEGVVTMGVNSDDGFRLTISPIGAPNDKFGVLVSEFDGGRGSSPGNGTEARLVVQQAGIYAMRLMWYEGQGGFNGEWYSVNAAGNPVLINDASEPTALKAYTSRTTLPPTHVSAITPFPWGSTLSFAFPDDPIVVEITDGPTPVDQNSISLKVNGDASRVPTKTTAAGKTTLVLDPPNGIWPPGNLNVELSYMAGSSVAESWTVPMISYVTLAECLRTEVGTGREPGMNWLTHWIRTGTRANTVAAAEDQLANRPNDADPAGTPDGWYDIANVNFDQIGAVQGMFGDTRIPPRNDAELVVPGLPIDVPADPNYIVGVAQTFLEFPTPGMYYMGVNRDDGFRLTVASDEGGRSIVDGPNVQEIGVFSGGGGTDANNVQLNGFMAIHVPKAGVWPFRLLWYEGTGGGNVEWFQTSEQVPFALVNDNLTTTSLRAFQTRSAQPPAPDSVLCAPAPQQPSIAVSRNAQGQIVVTFEGALHEATNAAGPYTPVAGAASPFNITPNDARKFYRAVR